MRKSIFFGLFKWTARVQIVASATGASSGGASGGASRASGAARASSGVPNRGSPTPADPNDPNKKPIKKLGNKSLEDLADEYSELLLDLKTDVANKILDIIQSYQ